MTEKIRGRKLSKSFCGTLDEKNSFMSHKNSAIYPKM